MIQSIRLQNFQSHKDTTIEFVPGVNALIGLSRAGKSAVLRAARWVLENSPSGDDFISNWGGNSVVTVNFEDISVTRIKGKGVNQYLLQEDGKKEQLFQGFNQSVPDPIKNALNIHDFNMRFQHQGAFLLSKNGGEISRYLNQVAQLDSIDKAISNINAILSEERQMEKAERANAARLSGELMAFDYLQEAENQLIAVEKSQEGIQTGSVKYNLLFDTIEEAESINERIQVSKEITRHRSNLDRLLKDDEANEANSRRVAALRHELLNITVNEQALLNVKQVTVFSNDVGSFLRVDSEIAQASLLANSLETLYNEIRSVSDRISGLSLALKFKATLKDLQGEGVLIIMAKEFRDGLRKAIDEIKDIGKRHKQSELALQAAIQDFHNNFPDTCPLCGKEK